MSLHQISSLAQVNSSVYSKKSSSRFSSPTFNKSLVASMISLALIPLSSLAAPKVSLDDKAQTSSDIETITITGVKTDHSQRVISPTVNTQPDLSSLLETLPGASINQNGKLTGIAQYRGLYGDRVAVKLNGHGIIGAGPNAMDTPLSYSPGITTESILVFRGIAPVSAAIETLGGAVIVENAKAQLTASQKWSASGEAQASYADVNEGQNLALKTQVANNTFAMMVYVDSNEAEDTESGFGDAIEPTGYSKIQSGIDLRWQATQSHLLGFSYDYTDTQNAGTPALPMDIAAIFGHRFNLDGLYSFANSELSWQVGYMQADHIMDNYSERENLTAAAFRKNTTDSETIDFAITYKINDGYGNTPWQLGLEGYKSDHNATITNPNNDAFEVANFNEVEESKLSAYIQWDTMLGAHDISSGIRVNYISADAQDVSHHMAAGNTNVGDLVNEFNAADRSVDDITFDISSEVQHRLDPHFLVSAAIARKERAPSYQERYLWFPMEATAGLADGNTYIGDINLDSEVAYQSNLGLSYENAGLTISADTFYQYIDGYIQGLPSEDAATIMVASMMAGDDNLLQFSNVDARLYGIDGALNYKVNAMFSLNAAVSYVRGKRADIDDDLYRMAPLNVDLALQYTQNNWAHQLSMHAVAKQNKVAALNEEEKSAGYATFAFKTQYQGFDDVNISAGIDNLFDKAYSNHLGGYNRVNDATETEKDRVAADGRNIWVGLSYSF